MKEFDREQDAYDEKTTQAMVNTAASITLCVWLEEQPDGHLKVVSRLSTIVPDKWAHIVPDALESIASEMRGGPLHRGPHQIDDPKKAH